MPRWDRVRCGLGVHGLALLGVLGTACAPSHVQLLFASQSPAAESYRCTVADAALKPEERAPRCERPTVIDPRDDNRAHTARVDVPQCDSGQYHMISILDADTDAPTINVRCGQSSSVDEE